MDKLRIKNYIKNRFKEYYSKYKSNIKQPDDIRKREFGVLLFQENYMMRHKTFHNINDLRIFIESVIPSDAYYSSAYYQMPEKEMDLKGWLGSDLVFDIDADHLSTSCKFNHDEWICEKCGMVGKLPTPRQCPKCGFTSIKIKSWICELCLNYAKEELFKLYDMIIADFGFNSKDIDIFFTGHRGYHLHVKDKKVKSLTSEERKEIVDYLSGTGLDSHLINLGQQSTEEYEGWKYRIYRELERLFFYADDHELKSLGLKDEIMQIIQIFRSEKQKKMDYSLFNIVKSRIPNFLQYVINICSSHIDSVVTTDIHRLIRLVGTLNSKTGLQVIKVNKLESFDSFKDSVAIKGYNERIYITQSPKFRIGDSEYGPFKKITTNLPIEAALFLICKEKAYPCEI